mgnify:CR=1 FL=1
MDSEWVRLIVSVLSGLAATIPLVIQLVKYVRKTIQDKNWPEVVKLVTSYMERAETMFEKGADRKEWVMAMIRTSAANINYDLDDAALAKISALIDDIPSPSSHTVP